MHSLSWFELLLMVPLSILGITLHGWIQGIIAKKSGDTTVSDLKRDKFNPLYQVNIAGLALLFLCGFGWHKPFIYDKKLLKKGRLSEILIAISGPISHIPIIMISLFVYTILPKEVNTIIRGLLFYGALGNIIVFIVSILPIPPMDGFTFFVTLNKETYIKIHTFVIKWLSAALFILLLGETFSKVNFLPFFDLFIKLENYIISII